MLAATSRTPQEFSLVIVQLETVGMHPVSNNAETLVDVSTQLTHSRYLTVDHIIVVLESILCAIELLTFGTVNFQKLSVTEPTLNSSYRVMHFSAKRGIAIACRLSVRLSVCNVGEL